MAGGATFGRISEAEFASLLRALSSTAKGRAFLNEYRQRFQPEDTLSLVESLRHIEATMAAVREQLQPERLADELRHVAMSLHIALDGVDADPDGEEETARRFAIIERARRELHTLAASLAGTAEGQAAPPVSPAAIRRHTEGGASYRLRDPGEER